jgi:hypothetical protein
MKAVRIALLALAATSLLAMATSTATAGRLSFTAQPFKIVWENFTLERISERVTCALTLEGSYRSTTFAKSIVQFGSITRAAVASCRESTLVVLTETLPWSMEYLSFSGALPTITRITLRVVGLSMRWGSLEQCLVATSALIPLVINFERETIEGATRRAAIEFRNKVRLTGATCFGEREATPFGFEGVMTRPETGAIITVRLI